VPLSLGVGSDEKIWQRRGSASSGLAVDGEGSGVTGLMAASRARNFFDPMMRQFETSTPEFFEAYQSARGAFKPGARAKRDENGQPVAKWRQALAAKKEAKPVSRSKAKPANAASTPANTVPLAS
jgi:hypothetical protein